MVGRMHSTVQPILAGVGWWAPSDPEVPDNRELNYCTCVRSLDFTPGCA